MLTQRIDALCKQHLADFYAVPDNELWQKRRAIAWELLNHHAETPLGQPPWRESIQAIDNTIEPDFSAPIEPEKPVTQLATAVELSNTVSWVSDSVSQQPATFTIDETDHSSPFLHPDWVSDNVSQPPSKPKQNFTEYAWKPHEPRRLERTLTALSGWHSLAVPFLMQNIGWFIGVFCFIAGSLFLVHSTTGYASKLIAFFAFFIFTLALLFGGYSLRQKRPDMFTSSTVIFILSMLLIPLTAITATQLLISTDTLGLQIVSGLLVLVELGVFYGAVTLVAGLMDRSLQQGLPPFFLGLTATSALQLIVLVLPFWQVLAVIHLLILAILSAGIYKYASQWLQSIFVDQHKIAYFAAGTLVYAALVSFVFISTGNGIDLPDGYYGFFLMLLCMLLFFVDGQFKQWTEQYAYLSRFSFFVYGLSVLALCIVAPYSLACILTLMLAIGLYGFIVWRYLTFTPLSIFLACCFWLYGLVVLQHLPEPTHLLASLPVLLALHRAAQWALAKRQSAYLALIVYRVLYSLLVILTVWSLVQSESGWLAMLTAITAGTLLYYALKSAPQAIFTPYSKIANDVSLDNYQNLLASRWFYSLPVLGVVTVFYAPRFALFGEAQFSLGLLLLAGFWAYLGLSAFFKANSETDTIAYRINSALLSLGVGLLPLWAMANPSRIVVLLIAGAITLWLSYKLLSRGLFYLLFILWGGAFALLKATYFPPPSNGMVTVVLGIILWCWLWFVERHALSELNVLQREHASQKMAVLPSFRLLGVTSFPSSAVLFKDVIHAPLEQLMVLAWLLTMKAVIVRWLMELPTYGWLAAIFLASLLGVLLIIRYLLIKLLPMPIVLVMGALLLLLKFIGLSTDSLLLVCVLFGLVIWQSVIYSVARPFVIKLATVLNPLLPNESERIVHVTHHTAFFIVLSGVVLQLLNMNGTHSFTLLLTLLTTAGFLWLSDRTYSQLIVRYLVLGFAVLTGIELVSLTLHPFTTQTLATDDYAGLLFALFSLALAVLSTRGTSYSKPASITAMMLAFAGAYLQTFAVINSTGIIAPLDYSVLVLAGFSLLLANAKFNWAICNLSAFSLLIIAVLWLENSLFHANQPFSCWLGVQTFADLWVVLGLLSLMLSLGAHRLAFLNKLTVYCVPFNTVATLCFVWTLLGTLTLFFASAGQNSALPLMLLILLVTTFSLSKNCTGAAQLRGLASACLPTLAVFSLLPATLDGAALQLATVLSGYALWCCASFVLPRFNQRMTERAIEPLFFPYLGLLLVVFSGCWWRVINEVEIGVYCLELSAYCLLMLRFSAWRGFSWLSAFAFTGAGLAFNVDNENLPINLLLWGNLQLLLVNGWNRKGKALAQRWQWQSSALAQPFEFTATLIFIGYLLVGSVLFWITFVDNNNFQEESLLVGILLSLSFLHALWLRFSIVTLHGFIYTLFLVLWSIYITYLNTLFQPPLLLALWGAILLGLIYVCSRAAYKYQYEVTTVVTHWLQVSVLLATLSLVTYSIITTELLISLAIITGLSAALGWKLSRSSWQLAAGVEFLIFCHLYPLLFINAYSFWGLLPWYALQLILLACVLLRLASVGLRLTPNPTYALVALSLIELCMHGVLINIWVMTNSPLNFLFAPWDAFAAISTGLIISVIGVRHVRYNLDSHWLYGIVILISALGFYSRLLLLGNAPVSLWDTSLLIGFAYSLFFLQRFFPSKPLLNSALFMPVLAIFTVPLQLASSETSGTLIMTGLLYMMMRRHTQQKIPLYLALLAFNAGVYVWIPSLVDSSQLIQIYVIPAALTSLLLLHLHSRELKPSVLMASRLAATGTIYACATVDVFLRPELSIFIVAMVLSVAGILIGIALRTRAFLYTGVSFLLLNVLGQLLRFYPEQGLGKAIVLMVMGAVILSVMIWFNIKKAAILQRLSVLQAEMQSWE
jgi:hypothetical protein